MTGFIEVIQSIGIIGSLLVSGFGLWYAAIWDRKKATLDKLEAFELQDSLSYLDKRFNYRTRYDPISYREIQDDVQYDREVLTHVYKVLQYYSSLTYGVERGVYSKAIVDMSRAGALIRVCFLLYPFICEKRKELERPNLYRELEEFARKTARKRNDLHEEFLKWAWSRDPENWRGQSREHENRKTPS